MMVASRLLYVLSLSSFFPLVNSREPRSVKWSETTIGPDGPWNVVEVVVGYQSQVSMFAGATWSSWVLTSSYCNDDEFGDFCDVGSCDEDYEPDDDIGYAPSAEGLLAGLNITGPGMNMVRESMNLEFAEISNHSLNLIEEQYISYPNGDLYPLVTGCLSVGAPSQRQIFGEDSVAEVQAEMIPWNLEEEEKTPSSSFGLHIGSAVPGATMEGSLVFGGYDKNRIVGPVLKLVGNFRDTILLRDISIRVISGDSPFDFDSDAKDNLLQTNNSDSSEASNLGLDILLEPCSPSLTLPKSTCDNVAKHLPVTYDEGLGLYTWDVDNPRYKTIVRSASTLSFQFMGETNTETITIDIPFRHLNLTLEPPLTSSPMQYFPCSTGGDEKAVLGRAFFQDAFLGGNWESNVWWLGQAPGPNIQSSAQLITIESDMETIESSPNDWEESWTGIWEVSGEPKPVPPSTSTPEEEEMEQGTKVGIGVGVGVGTCAFLLIVGFVLWMRRRGAKRTSREREAPLPETTPASKSERCFHELENTSPSELQSHSESGYLGNRTQDGAAVHELP